MLDILKRYKYQLYIQEIDNIFDKFIKISFQLYLNMIIYKLKYNFN